MGTCLRVENLTKRYGRKVAVGGVSFHVEQGEVFGLLGPNGAGKSTTLHMLTGLVRPTSGAVHIFGKALRAERLEIARRVGVLTERPGFYEHLTVSKNLEIASRLAQQPVTLNRALDRVGLLHVAHKPARTLSQGLRQRLGLALAFLTEPELLILDEPTSGLDGEHREEILALLRHLAKERRITIVLSTHSMDDVEYLCHRVAVLKDGRLTDCAAPPDFISYDQSVVELLIDAPEPAASRLANEVWVESAAVHSGRLVVRLKEPNTHQLVAFLIAAGYRVSGVFPRRRTLQEHVLKVVNR